MPTATKPRSNAHFDQLKTWLTELHGEKTAAARGETTHPSKSVDDGTEKVTTGARAAENTKDIKHMVSGNAGAGGHTVDGAPEGLGKEQDEQQLGIGLTQSSTGKDPAREDNFKDRPEDIKTHENKKTESVADAEVGPKYSFDLNKNDEVAKAAKALGELADAIMADMAIGNSPAVQPKQASSSPSAAAGAVSPTSTAPALSNPSNTEAAVAGYELARALGLSKDAADQVAVSVLEGTVRQAVTLADRVGQTMLKLAKDAEDEKKDKKAEGEPEDPAAAGPPKDVGGGAIPEAIAGLGGGAPPGAGGPPGMDAGAGGAPPGADAGGPPGAGGQPNEEQALQELAMALMELGIQPEQLMQAMQSAGGGGGMGGPPGAGGPPPGAGGPPPDAGMPPPGAGGPPPDMGAKVAAAVIDFKRSGKFQIREAKTAAERKLRSEMKDYVRELIRK